MTPFKSRQIYVDESNQAIYRVGRPTGIRQLDRLDSKPVPSAELHGANTAMCKQFQRVGDPDHRRIDRAAINGRTGDRRPTVGSRHIARFHIRGAAPEEKRRESELASDDDSEPHSTMIATRRGHELPISDDPETAKTCQRLSNQKFGRVTLVVGTSGGPIVDNGAYISLNDYAEAQSGNAVSVTTKWGHMLGLGHNSWIGDILYYKDTGDQSENIGG